MNGDSGTEELRLVDRKKEADISTLRSSLFYITTGQQDRSKPFDGWIRE
jgi:hypothetical protein